ARHHLTWPGAARDPVRRRDRLAATGLRRQERRPRDLADVQPRLLAERLSRVPGPLESPAGAARAAAGRGSGRLDSTGDVPGDDRRVVVAAAWHDDDDAERRLPRRTGAHPVESRADLSIG